LGTPPIIEMARRQTILVAGCAGFIGWKVCEQLLAGGCTVVGVDNLNDAYDARLKDWRLAQLQPAPGFHFHRADITDRAALRRLSDAIGAQSIDAVINLAARAGVRYSVVNPWIYLDTNVSGTLNLLEMCREMDVRKFVLASSSSLYGRENPLPYTEDQPTDRPISPYAASKKAAEALCYSYHHLYGIDMTVFRYFTVYGPAGRPDMMPFRLVQWISEGRPVVVYGDGSQSRDFTFVEDIARGTIAGLARLGFEVLNLGSDRPVSLIAAIGLVESLTGRPAEVVHRPAQAADMPTTWADIRKAQRLLGWRPSVSFEEGMARLVDWYRQQRGWAKDVTTATD
jgi:UDP-glucuronate 4-epimerase